MTLPAVLPFVLGQSGYSPYRPPQQMPMGWKVVTGAQIHSAAIYSVLFDDDFDIDWVIALASGGGTVPSIAFAFTI